MRGWRESQRGEKEGGGEGKGTGGGMLVCLLQRSRGLYLPECRLSHKEAAGPERAWMRKQKKQPAGRGMLDNWISFK